MRGVLLCTSRLSDRFCIGSCIKVQCHFLVPRERFMHQRGVGGEGAWSGILARANLLLLAAAGKGKTTLNDGAFGKYSAFRTETSSGKIC